MNWEQNGGGVGYTQPTSGLGILTYPSHADAEFEFCFESSRCEKSNGIFNKAVTSPPESGFHFFGERKECLVFGQERRGVSTKR